MERFDDDLHEEHFRVDLSKFQSNDLVDDVEEQLGDVISRTYLVGKVHSEHFFNAGMFKSSLNQVWNLKGAFRVAVKKNNIFLVGFEYEEDCEKVYKGCPWLIANAHTNFRRWLPHMSINQVPLRLSCFWIQLHELPLDFLEGCKIREICKVFTSVVQLDTKIESRLGWNGYIRARIEFFPEKPLVPGIHVKDSIGIEHWVKVRYERLGEFCYRCGRVTHATRRCTKPKRAHEGQELESIYSFGPWLRAKEAGHRPLLLRKPILNERKTGNLTHENANVVPPDVGDGEQMASPGAGFVQRPEEIHTPLNVQNVEMLPAGNQTLPNASNLSKMSKKKKMGSVLGTTEGDNLIRTIHMGWVNTAAEVAAEIDTNSSVSKTAKKQSWKRMARATQLVYQPIAEEALRRPELARWSEATPEMNSSALSDGGNTQASTSNEPEK
ncbi:hypothetical protein Tsubulata_035569 [Turnera subulata]|uniref:CCHC-type domain-containing protein n=1 Tax=Turnera subulata TaxID=218843 RepID=A0A9Q0FRL3_9ROSI|nr:hypothetical protein Tsubulata_035569 [Turnera subulata]